MHYQASSQRWQASRPYGLAQEQGEREAGGGGGGLGGLSEKE